MEDRIIMAKAIADPLYPLTGEALKRFSEILVVKKYDKGDIILNEGQICRYICYVQKGLVRQFYYKHEKDLTEHFSTEGFIFICIESFFKQIPTYLMAEALEPVELYCIPHDPLEALATEVAEVEVLYRKIMEQSLIGSQRKADFFRFETARERYDKFIKAFPEAAKRAALIHIASFLLMTPETLSRVRAGVL